jgi:endo-1,3-1,4-beta-glycanase ExoK
MSDGWANGSYHGCLWSAKNVKLRDGKLDILLSDVARNDRKYTCGEIQSLKFFGFGTYEVRMKAAPLNGGLVSAFFSYTGPPHGASRPHDEIDFEFIGRDVNSVTASYHAKGNGGRLATVALDFDPRADFNDYAFYWGPDRIIWYANGKVLREVTRSENEAKNEAYPTTPQKIFISLWNGTAELDSWLGKFTYPGEPLVASYDFIAFTKLGDKCHFEASIVCKTDTNPVHKN